VPRKKSPKKNASNITAETVRKLALELPSAEEGTSYGTPAFRVQGCLFARMHQDGDAVVVKIDLADRTRRMQADPEAYYVTDHYLNYPMMLVRFAKVSVDDLRELLQESWRRSAPARLVANFDARS
jgi:hypothetical protein